MDIGNVNNLGPAKADELKETPKVRSKAVNAYAKAEEVGGDSVSVSSKAKLMHTLREKMEIIPDESAKVKELREKIQSGSYELSPEEIVHSILSGTLFDAL